MTRQLLTAAEVAQRLHKKREWLYKRAKRAELEALGFPPPVPGCGMVWDPAAIDAWLDQQMPAALRASRDQGSGIRDQKEAPPDPSPEGYGPQGETRDDLAARGQAIAERLAS